MQMYTTTVGPQYFEVSVGLVRAKLNEHRPTADYSVAGTMQRELDELELRAASAVLEYIK